MNDVTPHTGQTAPRRTPEAAAGGLLTVDLGAIADNWRLLNGRMGKGRSSAAVVKADAYGLGADRVAPVLAKAGAPCFFVALPDEGVRLRAVLPKHPIYVLSGPLPGTEPMFYANALRPVLNSPEQVAIWLAQWPGVPYALQVDTGMNRLGLTMTEFEALADRLDPKIVLSHLACADEPDHPLNARQRVAFQSVRDRLPKAKASLANSSGHFLGADYLFDLGRPGVALYGGNPAPGKPNPMHPVVRLDLRILQVRQIDSAGSVGYGATHSISEGRRVATVAAGYADGLLRSMGNAGSGHLGDIRVPMVGRVSMDLITFDVTDVAAAKAGDMISVLDHRHTIDDMATEAGTIPYEILTSLGQRYARRHVGGAA